MKLLATAARLDIEDFLQKKVFLEVSISADYTFSCNLQQFEALFLVYLVYIHMYKMQLLDQQVEVKVKENWRQNEGLLKNYGYGGQIKAL